MNIWYVLLRLYAVAEHIIGESNSGLCYELELFLVSMKVLGFA